MFRRVSTGPHDENGLGAPDQPQENPPWGCRPRQSLCDDASVPGATGQPIRVVIVGQGYVGLPLAMRSVDVGYDVIGYDTDELRIKKLNAGESFIEDISSEDLHAAVQTGRYHPSTESRACAGFDVAIVTVPTPLTEGRPDLSFIESATRTLARYVRPGALVVLESTTYPGTTEEFVVPMLEEGSGLIAGDDFFVGYSPERIDPGNRDWTLTNTPKVVSGINRASLERVDRFYQTLVDRTVPVSGTHEAELSKLLENTFRHVNIALVNELAVFAAELGIDAWEAIGAAASKPFGFMPFQPGPGVGGHCLPIDPSYLSWRVRRRVGKPFRFVELANDINEHMPDYVVRRLIDALNRDGKALRGTRVLLLGMAYKRNTGDAREAPSATVAKQLLSYGAEVRAVDPYVLDSDVMNGVALVEATPEEIASADAVVLLTDHDAFDYDVITQHARYILDTRHTLEGEHVEHL
jgi:UDP-N-acetyl-D-glucosamine dehydrogenase